VGLSIYTEARIEQGATTVPVAQECVTLSERAVHIVCIQTGVSISREESQALAWIFSYDPAVHRHLFTQKYNGAARYGPKEAPLQIAHLVGLSDKASNMIVQCHVGQASWRSLSDMGLDRIV
jgi:hypothetical protein